MSTDFNLQQEADYVLGMMDMYPKDGEIASLLKMKGLTDKQVSEVLAHIKLEGYNKRIRQAKKILLIGLLIVIILGPLWLYMLNANVYSPNDDYMSRTNSRGIMRIVFYGFLYGIVQTVYGLYRYVDYSIKLKKHKTYI